MAKLTKLDMYREHPSEYVTPKEPVFVMVGPAKYLTILGHGAPGGKQFQSSIAALYAVAFTLKMTEKFAGHDYKVCHLEGQWWAADGSDFRSHKAAEWEWRLLIRVPDFITPSQLENAIATVIAKGKSPLASQIRLEELTEGRCVQMLHVGPYAEERSTVDVMQKKAQGSGMRFCGPHHEIYLSDPRRVPKERLKTILRYPVG